MPSCTPATGPSACVPLCRPCSSYGCQAMEAGEASLPKGGTHAPYLSSSAVLHAER